jgi:hypothetical protein
MRSRSSRMRGSLAVMEVKSDIVVIVGLSRLPGGHT